MLENLMLAVAAVMPASGNFAAVDAAVERMLAEHPLMDGAGVFIGSPDGRVLHEAYFGGYGPETVVPLASASKLPSALAVMTLVDGGELDPYAPVRTSLPEFSVANAGLVKSSLTVDEMYSMTSGFPGDDALDPLLSNAAITNDEAVALIATQVPLAALPGTTFAYDGHGMHVAGRVCEVVSGLDFDDFWVSSVAGPLGLSTFDWNGLGETENFRPSGGGQSSMRDYARILELLSNGGGADGVRLLAPDAAAAMWPDRTDGLAVGSLPPDAAEKGWGYAFGCWVERQDAAGTTRRISSPGAFGFTPWIDFDRGYYGIVMVRSERARIVDHIEEVIALIDGAIDGHPTGCGLACRADWNGDAAANVNDLLGYLGAYRAGEGDLDRSGAVDVSDLLAFLGAYRAGC